MICRILPHGRADGPTNMALDEALLDGVDADPSVAVLRTYEWSEPTLSLGYFQQSRLVGDEPRWRNVSIVRRPSGGGALWHDGEVTYAMVVPRSHPLAQRASDLYRAIHKAIAAGLASLGTEAMLRGSAIGRIPPDRPFLCFTDRDPLDIVIRDDKIVGSAQRRRPNAVLQHGSLPLVRSIATPEIAGFADLAGFALDPLLCSTLIYKWLPPALGLEPEETTLTSGERDQANALRDQIYRQATWTFRR